LLLREFQFLEEQNTICYILLQAIDENYKHTNCPYRYVDDSLCT